MAAKVSSCCIPGCKTKFNRKRNKKYSFFKPPQDANLIEKWEQAIPWNMKLKKHHKICELHFQKNDISCHGEKLKDRTIWRLKKGGNIKLNAGAIPTIFSNLPISTRSSKRKFSSTSNQKAKTCDSVNINRFKDEKDHDYTSHVKLCVAKQERQDGNLQPQSPVENISPKKQHPAPSLSRNLEKRKKLEKNRRAYIRECLEALKKQIKIDERKISDGAILKNALRCIQALKREESVAERELKRLSLEKIALQQRLCSLKSDLASHLDHIDNNNTVNFYPNPKIILEDNNEATTSGEKVCDNPTYIKLCVARQDGNLQTQSSVENNSSQKQPPTFRSPIPDRRNKLEKNRRARLKDCFKALKKHIPTMGEEKTSNVAILRNALRYIQALKKTEHDTEQEFARLSSERITLQQRLSTLKRDLSSHLDHVDNNKIVNNYPVVIKVEESEETTTASECGSDSGDDRPDTPIISSVTSTKCASAPSSSSANTVLVGPLSTNTSPLAHEDDLPYPRNNSTDDSQESSNDNLIAFNFLREHCHVIEKIPPRWAINAFEDYIICARWNLDYNIERKIVIKNDLTVKVYLENDMELDFVADEKVNSLKALSRLISRIEEHSTVQDHSNMGIHMKDSVNWEKETIKTKTQHQSEETGSHTNVDEEVPTSTETNTPGNCETVVSHITENHYPVCEITPVQTSIPPLHEFPDSILKSASNRNKVFVVKSNAQGVNHILNLLQKRNCDLLTREQSKQNRILTATNRFLSATKSTPANDSNVPISFDFLKENLHAIQKETPMWTISALENFIVCARWNSYGEIDRKIVINEDLSFKVYLENKETELGSDLEVDSLATISKLMLRAEHITVCPNIHINESKCDGFVPTKWFCRKRNLCLGCINWEKESSKEKKKRQKEEKKIIELLNLMA